MEKPAITYETLFELLRREKSREELQKLNIDFFEEVKKYLTEKKQSTLSDSENVFSDAEKEKLERQLTNIKRIIRELYERREKKIISMALNKSRVNAVLDMSTLLVEERMLFDSLLSALNTTRQDVFSRMFSEGVTAPVKKEEAAEPKEEQKPSGKTRLMRFLCSVPQFVGPDLEIYGPFEEDDVATLPEEVCEVLKTKNRAEEIEAES